MRDVLPFRGFKSLARQASPKSLPLLPCATRRPRGVFPIHASAPVQRMSEVLPPVSRFRPGFVGLAKAAPTYKATHLVVRDLFRCRGPDFNGLNRVVAERLADIWPLQIATSPATQRCIFAWKNASRTSLAKVWKPSVRGGCSVTIRGAPTSNVSGLLWTPN
jgi:hypothetical protein